MSRTKKHSLRSQINHAISCGYRSASRRADTRNNQIDEGAHVYSRNRAQSLHDLADSFGRWMGTSHPEIRMAKDITSSHVQEYICNKESNWSPKTAKERVSQFSKISKMINVRYSCDISLSDNLHTSPKQVSTRDRAMTPEHLDKLRSTFKSSTSYAKDGLELNARLGLRSCEVVGLKGSEIDLERSVAHIGSYAKGGRHRDVPIQPKDKEFFQNLKNRVGDGRICPISEKSYQKAITRHLEKAGLRDTYIKTGSHSIRKGWAQERMRELRGNTIADPRTSSTEKTAWGKVQGWLGHGSGHRQELWESYVNTK